MLVTGFTREGGVVKAMRHGAVVAQVPIPGKRDVMALTGEIDSVSIAGTLVLVERLCFTPGWTCVPWDAKSFPGGNGQQTYAGLRLFSFSQMEVDAGTVYVEPVSFTLFPLLTRAGAPAIGTPGSGSSGQGTATAPAAGDAVLDAIWDRALVPAAAMGTSRARGLLLSCDTRRINRLARDGVVIDRTTTAAPGSGPGGGGVIAQRPGPPIAVLAISLPDR